VIEFTGERVVPGQVEEDLWSEHFSRYAFASRFVSDARVLDIGCGTGYGTAELARRATSAYGLDLSTDAVAYARAHYVAGNVDFLCASANAVPFADNSFDAITAFEVIEHLEDWRGLLEDARRLLRPQGILFVSTPNRTFYAQSRGISGANPYHVHEFEAAEFRDALSEFFPQVGIFAQDYVHAVGFYSPDTNLPTEAELRASSGSPTDPHFLLALCSLQQLPDLRNFLYVPRASNVLQDRERHIASLIAELDAARNERDTIATSLGRELAVAREERDTVMHSHDALTLDLEEKTRWATGLNEEIINARRALEALGDEMHQRLSEAIRAIDAAESTVVERTRWAQDLDARLNAFEASRWVRLGRQLKLGPTAPSSNPSGAAKDG